MVSIPVIGSVVVVDTSALTINEGSEIVGDGSVLFVHVSVPVFVAHAATLDLVA